MKIIVNPHKIDIQKEPVNEKEIDITSCEFEFADEITNDYVKEAYFTLKDKTYKVIIENDKCDIPYEVKEEKGVVEIGVVAYLTNGDEEIKRYNPSPAYFNTWIGSLKENYENSQPITPTDKEQIEQLIANLEVDKQNKLTAGENITIENDVISATDTIYDDTEVKADIRNLQINKADKTEIPDVSSFIDRNVNDLTNYTLAIDTGHSIELSLNSSNYAMTLNLKNDSGNIISTQTIDLPLESVVISGSYDNINKKIVLTLQNGNTIDIPVGDLINGLQTEITYNNKLASDLVDDANSINKFVTSTEKEKLNGIETGAEVNVQANWNETNTTSDSYIQNKPTIPDSLSDLSEDSTHRTVTDTEKTTWNNKSNFSGSYTDLTNNPFILRNDEEYSLININSLVPSDGSSACYQFLNPVFITNLSIGEIELASGDQLSINSGSAAVVCSSGNYYFCPSSTTTEQGVLWDGNYCVDRDELDLLLEPKVETATMEQELAKKLSNSLIEEKDLLVTYEDTTTETLKLVVYK